MSQGIYSIRNIVTNDEYIGQLQSDMVVMMNTGIGDGSKFPISYAWPSDLIAIERRMPPSDTGHRKWCSIEGKEYYIPGEVCDPIGKSWFYISGDDPRSDSELLEQFQFCRQRGTNFLLNVPPNKNGLICHDYVQALMKLRKNANI